MKRIFLVEDDREIAKNLMILLRSEGFDVIHAPTQKDAVSMSGESRSDLALIDISLPDGNGFAVYTEIKQAQDIPIIFLTASGDEASVVTGLNMGADDYITKPFRPLEMVARVKAQLRRYKRYNHPQVAEVPDSVIEYSGLVMDVRTHECLLDEKALTLTPTEFEILRILLEHKGEVVSAERLFHEIWKDEYYSKSNNTITVHIRHLREKMADTIENPKYIRTIWGVGYKIGG